MNGLSACLLALASAGAFGLLMRTVSELIFRIEPIASHEENMLANALDVERVDIGLKERIHEVEGMCREMGFEVRVIYSQASTWPRLASRW